MFDFDERRQICLDGMKNAYDAGLHVNDEHVLNGTWKVLFEDEENPRKRQKTQE